MIYPFNECLQSQKGSNINQKIKNKNVELPTPPTYPKESAIFKTKREVNEHQLIEFDYKKLAEIEEFKDFTKEQFDEISTKIAESIYRIQKWITYSVY